MAAELKPKLTFDEYLEIESKAEFKSEFVNGEMYAMAGASPEHNIIKAEEYRSIPSLKEYLLIAQSRYHVEHYSRRVDDQWLLSDYNSLQSTICLAAINCELSLAEIYKMVPAPEAG